MLTPVDRNGYLGHILNLVAAGTAPFIEDRLRRQSAEWRSHVIRIFADHPDRKRGTLSPEHPRWDPYYTLKTLTDSRLWDEVFRFAMTRRVQNYAYELHEARNTLIAHLEAGTSIPESEVLRAIDNAVRLLTAISATQQADEARDMLSKVLVAIADEAKTPEQRLTDTSDSESTAEELVVHRIMSPAEPEFRQFLQLMEDEFSENVRDPEEDLERWLRGCENYKSLDPPCHDYFLVAKFGHNARCHGTIAGLIYASNYPTLGYLFISYIAINHRLATQLRALGEFGLEAVIHHQAMDVLLRGLAECTIWSNGVIAEIAQDEKNAILKRRFRAYASTIFNSRLYEVGITYLQPALDVYDLAELEEQDLIFMPNDHQLKWIEENEGHLPRDEIEKIINFVYHHIYAGNFDEIGEGERYRNYIESVLQEVMGDMEPLIRLRAITSRSGSGRRAFMNVSGD